VENGKMTKDLAVCIHGDKPPKDSYLDTVAFMAAINEGLSRRMH
jgi:isocitrate dehydrogenase